MQLTFHQEAAGAARHSKLVSGHTRVQSVVHFGDVGNAQASVIQHGDSGDHIRVEFKITPDEKRQVSLARRSF